MFSFSPFPYVTGNLRVSRAWGGTRDGELPGWDLVQTAGNWSVLDAPAVESLFP